MNNLQWNRTHGEMEETTFCIPVASAAPPAHGGGVASADAFNAAADGGASSSFPTPNLWQVLTDSTEEMAAGQLVQFASRIEESPSFRRGQLAELLGLLQQRLEGMPEDTDGDTTVQIAAGHLVLITHLLLRHQG